MLRSCCASICGRRMAIAGRGAVRSFSGRSFAAPRSTLQAWEAQQGRSCARPALMKRLECSRSFQSSSAVFAKEEVDHTTGLSKKPTTTKLSLIAFGAAFVAIVVGAAKFFVDEEVRVRSASSLAAAGRHC